ARLQSQIVSDLLDVSRIVTGKLVLEDDVVRLDQVVELAVDNANLAAAERDIDIELRIGEPGGLVRGSADRLQQVFGNLLSNAIKFSPRSGRIEVDLDRVEGGIRVRVRDYGEGIARALLPHVFDSFRQSDSSLRRRHGGLGLGLAITRSLVLLHGGSIVAHSTGEGQGAVFTVVLPRAGEASAAPAAGTTAAPGVLPDLRGVRVLVVDDN